MPAPTATQVAEWRGMTVVGSDGTKIGKIEDIYLDQDTDRPEWALVNTGMFAGKSTFMPLTGAKEADGSVEAQFTKAQVKDAPNMEPDGQLSQEEEAALYEHYGLHYTESRSDSGLPAGEQPAPRGGDVSGPATDDAMTRSEEELRVGTAKREVGRARLRKHVVTEQVQTTVPVQREEVRVEREPITDANRGQATDGPAISEEEHEVTLHAEEPVVEKKVVPKERVRLATETHTDEAAIDEQVRKERIDQLDGDRGTDQGI